MTGLGTFGSLGSSKVLITVTLDMGYKCPVPPVKPFLNQRQCHKCPTWAEGTKNWTTKWVNVFFSDKCHLEIKFPKSGGK